MIQWFWHTNARTFVSLCFWCEILVSCFVVAGERLYFSFRSVTSRHRSRHGNWAIFFYLFRKAPRRNKLSSSAINERIFLPENFSLLSINGALIYKYTGRAIVRGYMSSGLFIYCKVNWNDENCFNFVVNFFKVYSYGWSLCYFFFYLHFQHFHLVRQRNTLL